MTTLLPLASHLSDQDLLVEVKRAAAAERQATVRLIELLAQVDARRLYLGEGCSSLFTYCTQVLHLSEHAVYGRIEAARATRRFPVVLDLLGDGSVTLTAITLLAPHLTPDNHREVLSEARQKSKREVEGLVAALRPQPAVPSTVRKLPASKAAACAQGPVPPSSAGDDAAPDPVPPIDPDPSSDRDTGRARALQSAIHPVPRDTRQAASRAELATAFDPQPRPRHHP